MAGAIARVEAIEVAVVNAGVQYGVVLSHGGVPFG